MKYKMKDSCLELVIKSQLTCENFVSEMTLRLEDIYTIIVGGIFNVILIVFKRA